MKLSNLSNLAAIAASLTTAWSTVLNVLSIIHKRLGKFLCSFGKHREELISPAEGRAGGVECLRCKKVLVRPLISSWEREGLGDWGDSE